MISRSHLFEAKAFLCWDAFDDLFIQLVPLQNAAGYYFPPDNEHHSIILFYDDKLRDFCEPLFLLFHEAGHAVVYSQMYNGEKHRQELQRHKGPLRAAFEKRAWEEAELLFVRFVEKIGIGECKVIDAFKDFSRSCINSYSIGCEKRQC